MSSRSPARIVFVSGSIRTTSLTRRMLKLLETRVKDRGLDAHFVCAREFDLPLFQTPASQDCPNAELWRGLVRDSHGLIVGSPEYHGSFTGALKNMIDYLDFPHIEGKPVGLIAAAGGPKAGISTLSAMRLTFRALHVPVVVEQAAVWKGDLDPESKEPNADVLKQLYGVVDGVCREIDRSLAMQ